MTKSVFTWRPISSKSLHHVSIVSNSQGGFFPNNILCGFSTGAVSARNIQLVKKKQMRCQGVVCATKVRVTDIITLTFDITLLSDLHSDVIFDDSATECIANVLKANRSPMPSCQPVLFTLSRPLISYVEPCVAFQEAFGFIERADVVKEIFFHYSEFKGDLEALQAGDDVEFTIKDRNVGFQL